MSRLSLKINRPELKHLHQIVELDRHCLGGLWTIKGYQQELESLNSSFLVLSIESQNLIIGCGCFWSILEEAHITLLMIHPDYQKQGLGQLLLYEVLKDACQRQLERATLEVRVSNYSALSLYEKFGFKIAGRRKGYYQETGEDALILWRGDLHYPQFQTQMSNLWPNISDRLNQHHWQISW
ncbi:ribosomal protein S18-alanine N-acetyltransferase [Aphanothece sacrum]|uniref:Ribosomal-protein-alanine acetyltransferase n=1 Tax=Aphanothece sacrum FPU1 TaxID=1920663 RepID=A0A401IDR7_APHSA|nr:ribosomal protein S18-alanine N-acetyltransferase [Aphanothece sacrum]GBF79427.1 ribosomal-protein-alanine acetyltransferase [Aphanothece sacrum FPU1]GBF86642.1 ribosomal-protein-alanine acetyltransferase [Aphanothece sacrum FPU3]